MNDRMFHVLVLGGMALVGCGGSTLPEPDRASGDATPPHGPEDAGPTDATSTDVAFPFETNAALLDGSGSLDDGSPAPAVALLGAHGVPRAWRGLPKIPPHDQAGASTRALLHVVEMCCLNETMTGVYFSEMHNRTTHPAARLVVESLLEDEIDHGRVGWAYLAARARSASLAGLAEALPAMLDRTFGRALRGLGRVEDNDAMEAFGYVRDGACKGIFRRALRDVIIPGFETLGVDLSAVRAPVAAWLEGSEV